MHPELAHQLAVQHVNDMRVAAVAARRARQARRARRGPSLMTTRAHQPQPCPQPPCTDFPATRQPLSAKAA